MLPAYSAASAFHQWFPRTVAVTNTISAIAMARGPCRISASEADCPGLNIALLAAAPTIPTIPSKRKIPKTPSSVPRLLCIVCVAMAVAGNGMDNVPVPRFPLTTKRTCHEPAAIIQRCPAKNWASFDGFSIMSATGGCFAASPVKGTGVMAILPTPGVSVRTSISATPGSRGAVAVR